MEDGRLAKRVLVGGEMERDYLKEVGLEGMILLKQMLKKWDGEKGTGLLCFMIGTVGNRLWMR
jgi:hypothetical protein